MTQVAIVGMACRYPDARSPQELWENVVAARRAFRRLPDVRMRLADYWDPDPAAADRFHARYAAVLDGYEFDRVGYKIAGSTYRSTDLTHWLALDMAALALADAGFPMGEGLPRARTGVIVGNTLTGEFTRANQMRLRWPYVRRVVAAALKKRDWDDDKLDSFLEELEETYKSPFPAVNEDTLAGALSNTIAGRICNYFDLNGGGYTVDGACSSSLLSVATACRALRDHEVDVAIAGGVDLSIDPFEIIGFAKTEALASGEMRVYDRGSNGFWPGEGCGMVVLMRADDAAASGRRSYATVAGWGISSDGKGGITRPEAAGYRLMLRRAYEHAGFGIETVALFEGHGTGTKVGDTTELNALAQARLDADVTSPPAAIGSIKGMIGHTKAAAGVAGLIKATSALYHEVIPPTTGCVDPHELFDHGSAPLRIVRKAEAWPAGQPLRAGVTGMGFGGINAHIVLENTQPRRRRPSVRTRSLASSMQDAELLLIDGGSPGDIGARLERVLDLVPHLSYAQLGDLSAALHRENRNLAYRAAVVVRSPDDAATRLDDVLRAVRSGQTDLRSADGRTRLGLARRPGRIGFLFPGQGSGCGPVGGALRRRFADVEDLCSFAGVGDTGTVATEVAQPRIVAGALAGLRVLGNVGVYADVAVGHSLGELVALCWAGAMTEEALLRVVAVRGRAMAEHSAAGTMASLAAGPEEVRQLTAGMDVVIAGYNGPTQTVVAGSDDAVLRACERANAAGVGWVRLPVSHAFHSPLMQPAARAFGEVLARERFAPLTRPVISTVTADRLAADADIADLLHRQITEPVLFAPAVRRAAAEVDLFVEVGPGTVLGGLAAAATDVPVVSLDTDSESLENLLRVCAESFALGLHDVGEDLLAGRLTRPLTIGATPTFLESPCEQAPVLDVPVTAAQPSTVPQAPPVSAAEAPDRPAGESTVDLVRRLAAERAELPLTAVRVDSRLLDDLHLSSITVGQLANQVAQILGVPPASVPTSFATATVRELADALDLVLATGGAADTGEPPVHAGVANWVRAWSITLDEVALPEVTAPAEVGRWRAHAESADALAEPLRRALEEANVGAGVLVCLPAGCTVPQLQPALAGAVEATGAPAGSRFVLVQRGRGAAALAKTLRQEAPHLRVTVVHLAVDLTAGVDEIVSWIRTDVATTTGFLEVHYDASGTRRIPTLRPLPVRARSRPALGGSDVLLATGGGKGITAEIVHALAVDSGARVGIIGRADPATDPELAANLARIAAAGIDVRYARADVTRPAQVRTAVADLTAALGPATALIHGAGRNEPAALTALDLRALQDTCAPKVDGLRAVLDAIEPDRLRVLVTLGSIIGRAGLRGEAHYGVANEWLAGLTEEFAQRYPDCRTRCLEWTVWSGVGMGERLAVVESLSRGGATAVTPEHGIAVLRRLLDDPSAPVTAVVCGRTGGTDTLRWSRPDPPLLRFTLHPLVHYHGVELVAEVDLSVGSDPYLGDHRLDGNLLFPAVLGLEAMAQAAVHVTGRRDGPIIERAEFLRPIVVPPDGSTTIHIAALVRDDDTVDAVIRSAETMFGVDHFRASLRFGVAAVPDGEPLPVPPGAPTVAIDPANDLYGSLLFPRGRFQRLRAYRHLAARAVDAEVDAVDAAWFAPYLPATLLLGDPGVRDALMHGNQVCVPDATLLPVAVERVYPAGDRLHPHQDLRFCAIERNHDGDTYVYDIALRDASGAVIERWEGLRLRAVRRIDAPGPWRPALLAPYLERGADEFLGVRVVVGVEPDGPAPDPDSGEVGGDPEPGLVLRRRADTAVAVRRALGRPAQIRYRPDGRPELDGGLALSAAHGAGLTLCVVGEGVIGCDVQEVTARAEPSWRDLLGPNANLARILADLSSDDLDMAATRVWAAMECLSKSGESPRAPLTASTERRAGWTVLRSGEIGIATLGTRLVGRSNPVVCAILVGGRR